MSILIKGMKMPQNCDDCHFDIDCPYDESQDGYKMMSGRPRKCPLIHVPPHGRLGDLDKLKQIFFDIDHAPYSGFDGESPFSAADAVQIIRLAPTIIPAEEGEA
jgi:hypothetical protein